MPNASAPHIMCDATNLTVTPASMSRASCPLHRPGYMCRRQSYHRYASGAFIAPCEWPSFHLEDFPRDHLRDIFGGFRMVKEGEAVPSPLAVIDTPVLLVTRESQEYSNVFHAFTDVLNAFITMRMLAWDAGPRLVVLLDAHPPGPLDGLWAGVVAGGGRDGAKDPWGAITPSTRGKSVCYSMLRRGGGDRCITATTTKCIRILNQHPSNKQQQPSINPTPLNRW